jgi:hypothetical protein
MKAGRPLKYKTPEELQSAIDEYFEQRIREEKPFTVTSLAQHLDVYRSLLVDYGKKDEFYYTIKKAKEKILAWKEDQLYRNTQVAGVIFDLKNNYSDIYKDKHEVDHKGNVTLNFDERFKDV